MLTNEIKTVESKGLRLTKVFFLLFLLTLFFPIRYVFPTASSFATGLYSDFTSISLYLSDIFLLIAFFLILCYNYKEFKKIIVFPLIIAIFWLFFLLVVGIKTISGLNIWFFVKFIEFAIVAYGTMTFLLKNKAIQFKNTFLLFLLALGTIQSIIGLLQFINQSPLGLNLIGEQIIYPNLWGVAKIVSNGTAYIRAYGTFPHPNPFSAFLLVTILFNIYLVSVTTWKRFTKYWLNLALFVNILGLTVTFSRGAYLALAVGLLVFFGLLMRKTGIKAQLMPIGKILLVLLLSFLIFKPFLLTRVNVWDQATIERNTYNKAALSIIKDKPLTGVGMGESLLHMEQYSPIALEAWQIQPIHNFFLLASAELGLPGMMILIYIFVAHLKKLILSIRYYVSSIPNTKYPIQNTNQEQENLLYKLTLLTILICFLILMQFDHYFYTLQQTQMLLWLILGLIAAEVYQKN